MEVSKYIFENQHLCRLCGEMQENVIQFCGESREDFATLIKRTLGYLNMEFIDSDALPKFLCAACHLDAESTCKFLSMVKEGQRKLRQQIEESREVLGAKGVEKSENTRNIKLETKITQNFEKSKNLTKLDNHSNKEITFIEEAPTNVHTSVDGKSSSKYPKRTRKQTKRFPCDTTPYIETNECVSDNDTDSKFNNSEDVNAGTLITIKPIAELYSANGASLAEIISVDTDELQQSTSNAPDIRLVCEYCKEVFTKQHLFLKHLRTHNESLYECTECGNSFEKITELKTHQKLKQHKGRNILAKSTTTSNKSTQEKKMEAGSNNTTISIFIDDGGQITSIDSDVNAASKDEDNENEQVELDDISEQIEIIKSDSSSSTKKTSFKCLKCGKSYSTHYSVIRHHKQVHLGARTYKCQHCSASFKHGTNLAYHMAKHTGIRNYKCDKCTKAFVQKSELTLHMRTHTGDKPYVCEHCPKAFAHRSNMVTHMRLHSGCLPFKCETCGANFNSSSHLKLHKQMHLKHAQKAIQLKLNEEKATTSNITPAQSSSTEQSSMPPTSSLLRPKTTIVKSVEILPPIRALPGPDAVMDSSELKNLILKNLPPTKTTPPAPLRFECTQCLQRFKLRSALTSHLRTHTGEKPYRCPFCPRAFADASNFKRHKSLHKTASEQLQNVSKRLNNTNLLNELQREKKKCQPLPVVSVSPTHSIASDPDPDGLEAIARTHAMSPKSAIDVSDDDDTMLAMLEDVAEESRQQLSNKKSPSTSVSLLKTFRPHPMPPKSPPRLICISYPNPANPSDNKMTTFYL